jgi:hypothetical protein
VPCFHKHCSPGRVVSEFTVCQIGTVVDSTYVMEGLRRHLTRDESGSGTSGVSTRVGS